MLAYPTEHLVGTNRNHQAMSVGEFWELFCATEILEGCLMVVFGGHLSG